MYRWSRIAISTLVIAAEVLLLLRLGYCPRPQRVYFVDPWGRPLDRLERGSSLYVGLRALEGVSHYQLRLTISEAGSAEDLKTVSFARIDTDSEGGGGPFVLWHQSGVVGCSQRLRPDDEPPAFTYRSFDQAEEEFAGRQLTASV